jgi:UPF0716 protein FxsA
LLKLFFLFTAMPVLELMLLIEVGAQVGAMNTIALCLVTGFIGASLARSQGAGVLRRMQGTVQQGGLPAREIVDGVLILVAGVVLLTPGFVTDALGILLLLPPSRAVIRVVAMRWIEAKLAQGTWQVQGGPGRYQAHWSGGSTQASRESQVGHGPEIIPPELAPRPPEPSAPEIIDG